MTNNEETLVIEWDIPFWLQSEFDWWERHPNATYAEFEYSLIMFNLED